MHFEDVLNHWFKAAKTISGPRAPASGTAFPFVVDYPNLLHRSSRDCSNITIHCPSCLMTACQGITDSQVDQLKVPKPSLFLELPPLERPTALPICRGLP